MGTKRKDEVRTVLDAYFRDTQDSGRWTTQDIIDNLRDTVSLTKEEVNEYMREAGYSLVRDDDRLVWTME